MMKTLLDVITAGSMKAVAEIAASKNISLSAGATSGVLPGTKLAEALKLQITNGYEQAVADTQEAMEVLGEPMAKAMLNASCDLFAVNALKACGYLEVAA